MPTKEDNLKKLAKSPVVRNFVKKKNGSWGHEEWLAFFDSVKEKYSPIDPDQVGLLLEKEKAKFLAGK
ncbi:MAG: hypothetical protein A2X49_02650 [Lentisphaerae bacterium GWF2_52_8]|nr:MAG: hypothetical protein A2X49_02650 [Lentisphaerae bacterium GWF2_52_8]